MLIFSLFIRIISDLSGCSSCIYSDDQSLKDFWVKELYEKAEAKLKSAMQHAKI